MSDRPGLVPEKPYLWRARAKQAKHTLICFPHAGAGAGAYLDWAERMPAGIELAAVQLPGRQERIAEDLITDVPVLVNAVVDGIAADLEGAFSFFGHSAGALLAFEAALALQADGRPGPSTLFVSGQPAPNGWRALPINGLPDQEFRAALTELGGIDAEVIADEEVMTTMVIPIVRQEFRMWERHRVDSSARIDSPIVAMTGDADSRSPVFTMPGWSAYTSASFDTKVFPGDHFYHVGHIDDVTEFITDRIASGPLQDRGTESGALHG